MRPVIVSLVIAIAASRVIFAQTPLPLTPEQKQKLQERESRISEVESLVKAGKFQEAIHVIDALLEWERGILGDAHQNVMELVKKRAELQEQVGEYTTAAKTWKDLLAIRTKVFGKGHWQSTDARLAEKNAILLAGLNAKQKELLETTRKLLGEIKSLIVNRKFADAISLFEQVAKIQKEVLGEEHPVYAATLATMASLHEYQKQYAKAEQLSLEVLRIRKAIYGEQHPEYANALSNLAFVCNYQKQYPNAEQYHLKALKIRGEVLGKRHPQYAESLNNLAHWHYAQGHYSKAEPFFVDLLRIRKEVLGEKQPEYAETLNNLAVLYDDLGRYAKAESLHLESLRICKEVLGEKHPQYATRLNNLAAVYRSMARYAKAEPIFLDVLRIRKELLGEKHPDYAASLNNLAILYDDMGQLAKAEPLYLESLRIRKDSLGIKHPLYASSLNHLAEFYNLQADYAKSEPLYLEALRIRKESLGGKHPDVAYCLNNLAGMYVNQNQYAKAEPLYLEAMGIRKEVLGEDHLAYATSLSDLAHLHYHQGQYSKAEPLYLESLRIRKSVQGEKHPGYASGLNSLAMLYQYQGHPSKAEPLYRQAIQILERHLEESSFIQSEADQLRHVAISRFFLNNYLKLPEADAATLYQSVFRWHGAVTARQTFARANSRSSPEVQTLINDLQDISRQMNQLVQNPPNAMTKADQAKAVKELDGRRETLEKKIASQSQEFAEYHNQRKLASADLQKSLPEDTALLDFLVHGDTTSVFVITKKSIVHIKLETGKDLAEEIVAFTGDLSLMRTRPVSNKDDIASKLRAIIWEPLEEHLKGITRVLICPDGPLCRLPFAALPGADPKKYLLEELSIVIIPVPQLLPGLLAAEVKKFAGAPSLLAVGDVDFDGDPTAGEQPKKPVPAALTRSGNGLSWNRLPNTKGEVEVVETLFNKLPQATVQKLLGNEATEAALERELSRHRFVHLATHGFFTPPKMVRQFQENQTTGSEKILLPAIPPGLSSGIVCAGANKPTLQVSGVLTATQIAELDLRNVELAVLSACETSLGELAGGEGVLGLQRAFQMAGARSTITTMWAVFDQSTAELMKRMYSNRLENGFASAEALREAQLWVLNNGDKVGAFPEKPTGSKRTPPKFWAAFTFAGDWR